LKTSKSSKAVRLTSNFNRTRSVKFVTFKKLVNNSVW